MRHEKKGGLKGLYKSVFRNQKYTVHTVGQGLASFCVNIYERTTVELI